MSVPDGARAQPRQSLADLVFARIERAIKSGAYKPDERLPTEHDLAAEFQVSRPVVRTALRRLREQGLIYSRQGSGSFVRQTGIRQPLGFGQVESLADLRRCYDFRGVIEPAAAATAALHHGAEGYAAITAALAAMEDATRQRRHREDADFAFHVAIARASGNGYFATAMEALEDHIAVGMKFHGLSLRRSPDGLDRVLAEHRAIAGAIAAREAERAHALMAQHLAGSCARLFPPEATGEPHAAP